jgi:hypothetical protein
MYIFLTGNADVKCEEMYTWKRGELWRDVVCLCVLARVLNYIRLRLIGD